MTTTHLIAESFDPPGAFPTAALEEVITAVGDLDLEAALAEQQRSA